MRGRGRLVGRVAAASRSERAAPYSFTMPAAKRVRLAGATILVAGIISAVILYSVARPDEALGILGVDVPTKREMLQLERMGGKSYILLNDLNDWFASLWHGQRLAYTVGVLSLAGFLGCRWLADLLAHPPQSAEPAPEANRQDA
jgi:hypothetical protein